MKLTVGAVFGLQRGMMQAVAERGRLEKELWTKKEIMQGEIVPGK